MSRSPLELVHAHFDGHLGDGEHAALAAALVRDPALAERFAAMALLEAALVDHERLRPAEPLRRHVAVSPGASHRHDRLRWSRSLAAILAIGLLLMATSLFAPTPSASAALAQLEASVARGDRQYVVRVVEPSRGSGGIGNAIDGATLSVRGPTSYVLATRPEQGDGRIVGSDGASAWSIPPSGPVRVSGDPGRFRGWLPGSQHGVPFVADALDAESLRSAYVLRFGPREGNRASIHASRRVDARRGPREITIDYDLVTQEVLRMRLDGLPRARGGPDAVELTLVSRAPLPTGYFSHHHHHAADRRVVGDDERPNE